MSSYEHSKSLFGWVLLVRRLRGASPVVPQSNTIRACKGQVARTGWSARLHRGVVGLGYTAASSHSKLILSQNMGEGVGT